MPPRRPEDVKRSRRPTKSDKRRLADGGNRNNNDDEDDGSTRVSMSLVGASGSPQSARGVEEAHHVPVGSLRQQSWGIHRVVLLCVVCVSLGLVASKSLGRGNTAAAPWRREASDTGPVTVASNQTTDRGTRAEVGTGVRGGEAGGGGGVQEHTAALDPLLPWATDLSGPSTRWASSMWDEEDAELRRSVMAAARARCLPLYLGANSSSPSSAAVRRPLYPAAVGTRVFGFGAEGSGGRRLRARSGRWVRFWIVSTDDEGNVLCNGGADERVTYADVVTAHRAAHNKQQAVSIALPPLEDLYEIFIEAVPHTSLSSLVVAAQMLDGAGFDETEDAANPLAVAVVEGLDALRPTTFRSLGGPSNPAAGYRAYYGETTCTVKATGDNTGCRSVAVQAPAALNDGSGLASDGGASKGVRHVQRRGVFAVSNSSKGSAIDAAKVATRRVLYAGFGVTEVQVFLRHGGAYDCGVAIAQTGTSMRGARLELRPDSAPVSLRPRLATDGGLVVDTGATAFPATHDGRGDSPSVLSLDRSVVSKAMLEASRRVGEGLRAVGVRLPDVLRAMSMGAHRIASSLPSPSSSTAAAPLPLPGLVGPDHVEVQYDRLAYRCVTGTFKEDAARRRRGPKPLCTAPLSAYASVREYKERFRRGQWVRLRGAVCDGDEHCLVAAYVGGAVGSRGLPPGFAPAASQRFHGMLGTEGWLWASDTCVVVLFEQDGIAERLLDGTWTAAWGSSVLKQPMSNFLEYRLGRPTFTRPFPVFMEELPFHTKRKKMPGFFSYREWVSPITNESRRLPLSTLYNEPSKPTIVTRLSVQAMAYEVPRDPVATAGEPTAAANSRFNLNSRSYRWLPHMSWGGCPGITAPPDHCRSNGQIGMGGTFARLRGHMESRMKGLRALYQGALEGAENEEPLKSAEVISEVRKYIETQLPENDKDSGAASGPSWLPAPLRGVQPTPNTLRRALLLMSGFEILPPTGSRLEKLTSELSTISSSIVPFLPTHLLLDFTIWRWPMEDDVYLAQTAHTISTLKQLYDELADLIETIWRRFGFGKEYEVVRSLHLLSDEELTAIAARVNISAKALAVASPLSSPHLRDQRLANYVLPIPQQFLPFIPPSRESSNSQKKAHRQSKVEEKDFGTTPTPRSESNVKAERFSSNSFATLPLIIWHAKPANLVVDAPENSRPSQVQLEAHCDYAVTDALASASSKVEEKRPAWEKTTLSEETRDVLQTLARDNLFFIVMPRFDMSLPFRIGNRYAHFGLHYGSSRGMCNTGGARKGYELTACLRKPWVDTLLAELWLNAIVSHRLSVRY